MREVNNQFRNTRITWNDRLNLKCALRTLDVHVFWLPELAILCDWIKTGLNCQRQKWQKFSEHTRFVRIFDGVYCRVGNEPDLSR